MEIRLSKHFTLAELTATETGLENTPSPDDLARLKDLCNVVLERIRDRYGKPVSIRSGYRSEAVNEAVGGAPSSQHRKGEAVDFYVNGVPLKTLYDAILTSGIPYDQIILERPNPKGRGWIHISYKAKQPNRRQALAFVPVDGQPRYVPYGEVKHLLDESGMVKHG